MLTRKIRRTRKRAAVFGVKYSINLKEEILSINELIKPKEQAPKKSDMDNVNEMLTKFIGVMSEKNSLEHEFNKNRLSLRGQELDHEKSVFKYKFWLLTIGLASLILIAVGLIFFKDKSDIGLSILSHIGAVIGGVLAGFGYKSGKST